MFKKKNPELDAAIADAYIRLNKEEDPVKYDRNLTQLERLHKLRNKNAKSVSPDTLAMITANLAGIVLIVGHERAHVIGSKALSFIMKMR